MNNDRAASRSSPIGRNGTVMNCNFQNASESTMPTGHKTCSSVLSALLLLVLAAFPTRGAVVLLDAETDRDVAAWSRLDRVTSDRAPYLPMRGAVSARLQVSALQSATGGRSGEASGVPAAEEGIVSLVSQMPEQRP
jgi:hypothetical protein